MSEVIEEIIRQIDQLLKFYEKQKPSFLIERGLKWDVMIITQTSTRLLDGIKRYAPPGSAAVKNAELFIVSATSLSENWVTEQFAAILKALKADYETGMLKSIHELFHADLFKDFLEMAEHLLDKKFLGPAAVVAGCVLEEHIRKLCDKFGIAFVIKSGNKIKYRKVDQLNVDLVKAGVYDINVQKSVTLWYGLRTSAAHGRTSEYSKEQITPMIQGIRDFISKYPA